MIKIDEIEKVKAVDVKEQFYYTTFGSNTFMEINKKTIHQDRVEIIFSIFYVEGYYAQQFCSYSFPLDHVFHWSKPFSIDDLFFWGLCDG
jgi:hypothetical protein